MEEETKSDFAAELTVIHLQKEALKKQRVERGRAARDERLALQAREEEEKNKRGDRENGFELDRPATPTTSSGDAARVVPGAFGSPVDHPGLPR